MQITNQKDILITGLRELMLRCLFFTLQIYNFNVTSKFKQAQMLIT